MAFSKAKYYDDVVSGDVFIGSTAAAGTAMPISTGTAVTCGLWNTNPKKVAVILQVNVGFTSGTIALGELGLANQYVGFNVATGAAMTAFTAGTPKNALVGAGNASSMNFTPSGATLAAGGTALLWSGIGHEGATGVGPISGIPWDVDGLVIVPPGQIVFICWSVAQTGLFTASMVWKEVANDA